MGTHHPIRKQVAPPEIPDKLYFRIGDVARLCEVPAYVLRFWETEFPQLKPNKGGTGQRLYRRRDVEMALRIKSLLYDQGYTIPGARQVFKNESRPQEMGPVMAQAAETEPVLDEASAIDPVAAVSPEPVQGLVLSPAISATEQEERDRRLSLLRTEMRDLLGMLSRPFASAHPLAEQKVQALRPRLVTAMKPARSLNQPDLFGGVAEEPPGPKVC
ncbi:MAG: MerR family transcriptional regulator [Acidobacteriaceae bacterium]|nr:MerR family transcriptional regulator [Acidobacteriaceae bacterium]